MNILIENWQKTLSDIAEAEKAAGRAQGSTRLLAVSKTFPAEDIAALYQAGQKAFGENRVQELESKTAVLDPGIEWHLIGHLQSNKCAKAVKNAHWIHSADSVKLIDTLEKAASLQEKKLNILLELHLSGEESKEGIRDEAALLACGERLMQSAHLNWKGFMTMAAFGADEYTLRKTFSALREKRDEMEKRFGLALPELSMGMSGDYPYAIMEGATMVRVGTAIFGRR